MYLYKVGTRPGVLIKQGVFISEVPLKRGSSVYECTNAYNIASILRIFKLKPL